MPNQPNQKHSEAHQLLIADGTAATFWLFSPGRSLESARQPLAHAPQKPPSVKLIPALMAQCHPRLAASGAFPLSYDSRTRNNAANETASQRIATPANPHTVPSEEGLCAAPSTSDPFAIGTNARVEEPSLLRQAFDARWHFLVDSPEQRFRTKFAESHVCRNTLPPQSAIRLNQDVSIASPEFTFLRMAKKLSLLNLAAFGSELCADFYYSWEDGRTVIKPRSALVTQNALAAFVEQASFMEGAVNARKALPFIAAHARSPREIQSGLVMGLPRRIGGQGIGAPILNHRIEHAPTRNCPQGHFICDLFWPLAQVDVEYEGFECHANRFLEDSMRRNALESLGITVITLTKDEFRELNDIIAIAKRITEKKGMRWRPPSAKELERMRRLHETVLSWSRNQGQPPSIFG